MSTDADMGDARYLRLQQKCASKSIQYGIRLLRRLDRLGQHTDKASLTEMVAMLRVALLRQYSREQAAKSAQEPGD